MAPSEATECFECVQPASVESEMQIWKSESLMVLWNFILLMCLHWKTWSAQGSRGTPQWHQVEWSCSGTRQSKFALQGDNKASFGILFC